MIRHPFFMRGDCFVCHARERGGVAAYLRHRVGFPSHTLSSLPEGAILVNGQPPPPRYRLKEGDEISVSLREEAQKFRPCPMPLSVLYEDGHLMAVSKPQGIPTHPSLGHREDTLANGVAALLAQREQEFPFRPVNRLDKDTSGIVLLAKNRLAAAGMSRLLQQGAVHKTYLALLQAPLPAKRGSICLPIARAEESIILRCVRADGDYALTRYRALGEGVILASPVTGRTHQLRVHFAALGHPILGDGLYGTPSPLLRGQALHALSLRFPHPITGEPVCLYAPPPPELVSAIAAHTGKAFDANVLGENFTHPSEEP